jgi:hypothetical protein
MSVYSGPGQINDGLVFQYDMGNSDKSWKGKPTTNEFVSSITDGYGGANESTLLTGVKDALGGNSPVTRKVGKIRLGNSSGVDIGTLYYGNTYTFSIYLRKAPDFTSVNGGEFDIVDQSSGGTWVDGQPMSGSLASNMTYEWRRFSVTSTHTNSASYHFVDIGQYNDTTFIYEWCCPQIEQSSFPTPYVPFSTTQQTRSSTQAIVDLTGQNTITASSLTYNSDGTFSFNGSSDRIECGDLNVSYLTLNTWVYKTSSSNNQGICRKNNCWALSQYNGTVQVAPGTSWTFYNTGYVIPLNTWVNICYVYSGTGTSTSQIVYINGTQIYNTSSGSGPISSNSNIVRIGYDDNNWYWGGNISSTKIYNRALSAAEVRQNFNALRGRYGI